MDSFEDFQRRNQLVWERDKAQNQQQYDQATKELQQYLNREEDPNSLLTQLEMLMTDPMALPLIMGGLSFATIYYLAMNRDVFKEIIKAIGNIPPDSVSGEVEVGI